MTTALSTVSTPESVIQQLQWRYATKKFDPSKKIPDDIWKALEQSLVLAPSSFGLQPWKFFVVRNPEIRSQLLPHSWGQTQVVDASHLVVFAIKKDVDAAYVDRYIERMAEVQQTSVENLQKFAGVIKGFMEKPPYPLDLNEWSSRQLYIALGEFMTAAAMLGVDTCPMEGLLPSKYDEVLGLPAQGYKTVAACPAGYRAADDHSAQRPKIRFKTEEVVEYVD
jgi:nitroreductase